MASDGPNKFHRVTQATLRAQNSRDARRRLGPLTHEQEVRIENLVISTATKISSLGGQVMQSLLEDRR